MVHTSSDYHGTYDDYCLTHGTDGIILAIQGMSALSKF